ncbi:MAG TPA: hypothetical protein VHN79_13010, partial [Lacunisphaera sp.]|nr:hypothetical protein [Lacunisphaera sp.]
IEAQQIIEPWLNGTLRPWIFFTPHFEHLPVWTRLLSWLQVALTGRWDPLVQMTVNAAFHCTFVWLAVRWVWQSLSFRQAGFATLVVLLGGALPFAWENIAWGFQSQFPLALIFLFLHVHGASHFPAGSRKWWLAQAAALAGLFTLASMWLAPLAIVAAHFWTRQQDRRAWRVPAGITVLGILLLALVHWQGPAGHSFVEAGRAPLELLHSFLHLLSWPSGLPGAVAIVQLPWLIHAFRLRGRSDATALDRMVFALGLWNCLQAAGLAFARTGDAGDYVSRYGDLLFIGTLAGAMALTRLMPRTGQARSLFLSVGMLWCGFVVMGLLMRATEGHARYFHQTAQKSNELRRNAIRSYLETGDRTLIEAVETRWVLTHSTDVLTQLLDQPKFRSLLPASVNPGASDDALGRFNRRMQSTWLGMLLAGLGLLALAAFVVGWRSTMTAPAPLLATSDAWPARLALVVGVLCSTGMLIWSNPLVFNRALRWHKLLGGDEALAGLTAHFAGPTSFQNERLQGAAPISPVELRNRFFGTAPAGPELQCV